MRLGPGRKEAWALSRALIWEVTPGDGTPPFTALPEKAGGWRDVAGVLRGFSEGEAIRLWHPVETPDDLARAWRTLLERQGISQPFVQAGREVYPITAAERDGREATRFAGRPVAAVPMIGLARVSGWRLGYRSDLHLTLAGCRFVLEGGSMSIRGIGHWRGWPLAACRSADPAGSGARARPVRGAAQGGSAGVGGRAGAGLGGLGRGQDPGKVLFDPGHQRTR